MSYPTKPNSCSYTGRTNSAEQVNRCTKSRMECEGPNVCTNDFMTIHTGDGSHDGQNGVTGRIMLSSERQTYSLQ